MRNLILLTTILSIASCTARSGNELCLYIGSYSPETAPGLYLYRFDAENGDAKYVSSFTGIADPSYMALSTDGNYLYSVSETSDSAAVWLFGIGNRTFTASGKQLTYGAAPCHINTDAAATFVVTANYTGGNVSVFPLTSEGRIMPASQILEFNAGDDTTSPVSHIHCAVFSPDEKYLFVTDLGKDKIYRFDVIRDRGIDSINRAVLSLSDSFTELEKGSGPRHLTFHPSGKYAYVINELSGKVTACEYSAGVLTAFQYIASDTTSGTGGKGSADIRLSPDGKFLYSSNRLKADGIAIFAVNPGNGSLTNAGYVSTGAHPRNFILTPDGRFVLVASRDRNDVEIFSRDSQTGMLASTGKKIPISKPVCLILR